MLIHLNKNNYANVTLVRSGWKLLTSSSPAVVQSGNRPQRGQRLIGSGPQSVAGLGLKAGSPDSSCRGQKTQPLLCLLPLPGPSERLQGSHSPHPLHTVLDCDYIPSLQVRGQIRTAVSAPFPWSHLVTWGSLRAHCGRKRRLSKLLPTLRSPPNKDSEWNTAQCLSRAGSDTRVSGFKAQRPFLPKANQVWHTVCRGGVL